MTTPVPDPAPVCPCCPRRLLAIEIQTERRVCRPCERRLDAELREVVELWDQLPGLLKPSATGGGTDAPRTPGPSGSKAPASLPVLSLLGGGATDKLLAEEDAWRREIQKARPRYPSTPVRGRQDPTLKGTVEWLRESLPWACHHYPDVDDLSSALYKLLVEMRELVTGESQRRKPIEPGCPMPAPGHDADKAAPKCGGQLTYDPRKKVIRCAGCRRHYGPADWDILGAAAGLITLPFTVAAA
ncbi:hypothetical protein ACIA7S_28525 [Streptomyces sp. NPDC051643]|uniref:hypothetical protein n=1 Tax=Streptomyces sp. NPDC051643 TaxID=3365665 RepID=UPI00379A172E